MTDPITTAREQTARVLATRELSCWEGEYSPEPEEYDDAHRRTTRAILEPSGPLAPLCAAYEAQLAEVTRERDEARAKIERYTKSLANVTAQEAWFIAACKRCQGTGIGTEEARAAGDNWSAAWDARAAAWEERDAAIKALCAEVSR
mgnify:CR=1 FL=1